MRKITAFILTLVLCLMMTVGATADDTVSLVKALLYIKEEGTYAAHPERVVTLVSAPNSISIKRMDSQESGYVAGAQITVYDSENNVVTVITTENEPYLLSGVLKAGETYTFIQTSELTGHVPEGSITLTVEDIPDTQIVLMKDEDLDKKGDKVYVWENGSYIGSPDNTVTLIDNPTRVSFSRVDHSETVHIVGSTITLTDHNGEVVTTFVTTGEPYDLTGVLTVGEEYTFTEIDPVTGHTASDDATLIIADTSEVQELVIKDSYEGWSETDPNFVISKKQLALTNGLRFYLKADKTLFTSGGYSEPTMVIEFNNGQTVVSDYVEEAQYYAFPFNDIAPHQMGYTFRATLHAYKNGVEYVSPALEYSVAQYCYDVFDAYKQYNYSQYAKLYTLLVDLLNYGAQAQIYTNTDTDNLVNANLTAEQQSHATELSGDFVNSRNYNYETIANSRVTWQVAALNLRDSIVMRLRFSASSIDGLTVKARDDKGNEWEIESADFEVAGSGTYNVYFEQFNVGRMSDIVYLTVYKGNTPVSNTCSFSIESYAAVIQQNAASYPDLAALTTAMMKYGKAAKAYTS